MSITKKMSFRERSDKPGPILPISMDQIRHTVNFHRSWTNRRMGHTATQSEKVAKNGGIN